MKKEDARRGTLKGSLTVEASVVTTVTILILFSCLILTMWLSDRVTVGAALREGVELGRRESEDTLRTWLEEEWEQLILMEGNMAEAQVGAQKASFGWESLPQGVFPGGTLTFSEQVERQFYDPPTFLRLCRLAKSLAE